MENIYTTTAKIKSDKQSYKFYRQSGGTLSFNQYSTQQNALLNNMQYQKGLKTETDKQVWYDDYS